MQGKAEHPPAGDAGPGDADIRHRQEVARAVATWRELATALAPIVGERGFAALYQRSVERVAPGFPRLGALADAAAAGFDPQALHAALLQHSVAQSAAAIAALRGEFDALLHQLIGPALAQELMARHTPPTSAAPGHGN